MMAPPSGRSGKFAEAIVKAIAGCRHAVDNPSTTEVSRSGPPSRCPTARPTHTKTTIAAIAPCPVAAQTDRQAPARSTTVATSSNSLAARLKKGAIRSAIGLAPARTSMPAKSGTTTEISARPTMAAPPTASVRPVC